MERLVSQPDFSRAMREVREFAWEGDYRPAARAAIKALLQSQMDHWADRHLADLGWRGEADR